MVLPVRNAMRVGAAVGRRLDRELAIEKVQTLPHAEQAETVASQAGVHVEADTGVHDFEGDAALALFQGERHREPPDA